MPVYNITNNEKDQQFEYTENGETARLVYKFYKKDIAFMHTIVPESLNGKGIASALATYAFDWAKEHNKKVMNFCPYVAKWLEKHPERNEQLDGQYTGR